MPANGLQKGPPPQKKKKKKKIDFLRKMCDIHQNQLFVYILHITNPYLRPFLE